MSTNYVVIIGLEIHAELSTASKMFCACQNDPFRAEPNANICPVCFGLPGALPTPNREAIRRTFAVGQALGSTLATSVKFDRKNYFYPDLPKGYQISQYDHPIATGGTLPMSPDRQIKITRLHLEEDTGKLSHTGQSGTSLVDYNRSGVPLMELVTAPVIQSAKEARAFCERYQVLLRSLGVASADMEKGEMRCEANISIQLVGSFEVKGDEVLPTAGSTLNPKVEIKNLNSFRSVERAIDHEIKRQTDLLERGQALEQETRGWHETKQKTIHQRGKESAHDYRYFPEPDIPELAAADLAMDLHLGALPWQKAKRYQDEYGLTTEDAWLIASDPARADYLDTAASSGHAKTAALLFIHRLKSDPTVLPANLLADIATRIDNGQLKTAVIPHLFADLKSGVSLADAVNKHQTTEPTAETLDALVAEVINADPAAVASYHAGRKQVTKVFLGAIMKKTKGQVNPQDAEARIITKLDEMA